MYKILLCWRYLKTRYIALASIISVMLGVATMIVVNSVMAGFSTEMRERIHGILADVVIETNSYDGAPDPDRMMATVKEVAGEYVAGMTATVEVYGMLSFQYHGQWITQPVTLIGIDPKSKATVGPLVDYLDSYHPIKQDGTIVRPALRSLSEPVGWELTSEARERRKIAAERTRWVQEHYGTSHSLNSTRPRHRGGIETAAGDNDASQTAPAVQTADVPAEPASPGPLPPDPLAAEATSETAGAATNAPEKSDAQASEPGQLAVEGITPGDPFGSGATQADPFASDPSTGGTPAETVDPAEPLESRVYVGIGLVSFQYEDPETGKLKTEIMVHPGEDVQISTLRSGRPPEPTHFSATVVDLFRSGMSEYDTNIVLCNLEALQKNRGMLVESTGVRKVTSIQLKLTDFQHANEVVDRLRGAFPPELYRVRTWEAKQGPLLAAVEVESAILNVLLFLIIAVAGFGILAIFFMIVVEKTRDIGILKALGASSRGVMAIFLSYGLALGIVGSGVGVILGLLFVRYINVIESWITWLTGRKVFDEKIYYFPEIPTAVHPGMVIAVAAGAMLIAVLASILPARRASRLHPVEALRYE